MFIVLGLLLAGAATGYLFRGRTFFKAIDQSTAYTIYAMLFIFGITIGANEELINDIAKFGMQATLLALSAILGSIVASYFAYKIFLKKGGRLEK